MKRPFGYFVHHQGRGHAERCAAIAGALPSDRPLTIFCARADIFPTLPPSAEIVRIPSLFEASDDAAAAMDWVPTPRTLHCAPLGWPSIREAMATITAWFQAANPALLICDVSAELAQLARICSVPHVAVLQHGNRTDPGHHAAYEGAAGLLAPCHADLAQSDWGDDLRARICFAGGLGITTAMPQREVARRRIDVGPDEEVIVVVAGGGGTGFAQAPLCVGARARPSTRWITIGPVQIDWHATKPSNLEHRGWVENSSDYIAAADLVISSTGDTTCQQILTAARPWLAIPEWRYFDEQLRKAESLAAASAACMRAHPPSSAEAWNAAIQETFSTHASQRQRSLIIDQPAAKAAEWLEALAHRLWRSDSAPILPPLMEPSFI